MEYRRYFEDAIGKLKAGRRYRVMEGAAYSLCGADRGRAVAWQCGALHLS